MKKTKIITISILGLLLLVPFMLPAKAAPAPYVSVSDGDSYLWGLNMYDANWTQWFTDGMTDTLASIWSHTAGDNLTKIFSDWIWDPGVRPQSFWPMDITAILAENTTILLSDYGIYDNITATPVNASAGWYSKTWPTFVFDYYDDTWYIVNDTTSFVAQSLYGGAATSIYALMDVPFAPTNINWTIFASETQANLTSRGGWIANTTVTEIANGYTLSVPTGDYQNNTVPITITVIYGSDGVLAYSSFEYGTDMLYDYYEAVNPVTTSPADLNVAWDYTGQSISWTATDSSAGNYTITRNAAPVVPTTPWVSGVPVVYNIPDGLAPSVSHTFEITFTDNYSNSISDSVVMTVGSDDITAPSITMTATDLVVAYASTDLAAPSGLSFSWTATDTNPGTYTIMVNGTNEVVAATAWASGTPVTYNLSSYIAYAPGVSTFEITFIDLYGNNVSDSVTITVNPMPAAAAPPGIPGFDPLIIFGITSIASIILIAYKKKKK